MLKTSFSQGIYTIQMHRPEARNALNREMRQELQKAFENPPEGTRLVQFLGVKEAFCAGQDLTEFDEKSDVTAIMQDEYRPIIEAMNALNVPIVAGVQGACAGAGVSLALACDVVLAADDAFFQIAFARVGLVPDILVTYVLPRLIGTARAQGMALTGERVSAKTAKEWGLIWNTYYAPDLEEECREFCQNLAQGASLALGRTRQLINDAWTNTPAEQFALEAEYQSEMSRSHDFIEGVDAFLHKRQPRFEGR